MKEELYIWYNRNYLKKEGFPLSDNITLFDTFESANVRFKNISEWAVLSYRDISFPPENEKYKFPLKQFLVLKQKIKTISFDYIEYHSNVKIVSESFLNFLKYNGLETNQYEIAELTIVDKNGKLLTEKKYFALRFGTFDDELFDFNEPTKRRTKVHGSTNYLFPDLSLKYLLPGKSIFVLKHFSYRETIIFKECVLDSVIQFQSPEIYKLKDFPYIYENQYDEELLPIKNQYQINQINK